MAWKYSTSRIGYAAGVFAPPEEIPDIFWIQTQFVTLHLQNNKLQNLPEEIGKFVNLKTLDLSGNRLSTLPDSFSRLTNLEKLNLSNNNFTEFPECLYKLPKLKHLSLSRNKIRMLPDALKELTSLYELDLSKNKLDHLPEILEQTTNIELLSLKGNPIGEFSFAFLKLPAYCTFDDKGSYIQSTNLGGVFKGRRERTEFIQLLNSFRWNSFPLPLNERIQLYHIFYNNLEKMAGYPIDIFFKATKSINDRLCKNASLYLMEHQKTKNPISEGAVLVFLSKLDSLKIRQTTKDLKEYNISLSKTINPFTTHLIFNRHTPLSEDYHEGITLVTEQQVLQFLEEQKGLYLLEKGDDGQQSREGLNKLLLSGSLENVTLAMEIIEGGGFPQSSIPEAFLAHRLLWAQSPWNDPKLLALQKKLQQHLRPLLSLPERKALRYFNFVPNVTQDATLRLQIRKYLKNCTVLAGIKIAKLLWEQFRVGYLYILDDGSKSDRIEFLKQFVKEKTLRLGELKELLKLPEEINELQELEKIDLSGCQFKVFPKVLLENKLPALKTIDLRNNPIKAIPIKTKVKLAHIDIIT